MLHSPCLVVLTEHCTGPSGGGRVGTPQGMVYCCLHSVESTSALSCSDQWSTTGHSLSVRTDGWLSFLLHLCSRSIRPSLPPSLPLYKLFYLRPFLFPPATPPPLRLFVLAILPDSPPPPPFPTRVRRTPPSTAPWTEGPARQSCPQ